MIRSERSQSLERRGGGCSYESLLPIETLRSFPKSDAGETSEGQKPKPILEPNQVPESRTLRCGET